MRASMVAVGAVVLEEEEERLDAGCGGWVRFCGAKVLVRRAEILEASQVVVMESGKSLCAGGVSDEKSYFR